jgi:hypothetical protein
MGRTVGHACGGLTGPRPDAEVRHASRGARGSSSLGSLISGSTSTPVHRGFRHRRADPNMNGRYAVWGQRCRKLVRACPALAAYSRRRGRIQWDLSPTTQVSARQVGISERRQLQARSCNETPIGLALYLYNRPHLCIFILEIFVIINMIFI